MGTVDLGVINSVPIQQIWPREASDFTPWLSEHLGCIAEKLGMELTLEAREAPVGDFSVDIVARDISTGRRVIIENQFWQTDHKHLGQLLTYAASQGASTVVWIAESIRPEHRAAIDFLNRGMRSALRFYALEMRVIRIDSSRPAFTLDLICDPEEDDGVSPAPAGANLSEREQKYLAFFQGLIDELFAKGFTKARKAQPQSWYSFSSENSDVFTYAVAFAQHKRVRTEVYIDCGDGFLNKKLFDGLLSERQTIESAVGSELTWERLDSKRACRVAIYRAGRIDVSSEELEEIKRWAISWLEKLRACFPHRIDEIWEHLRPLNLDEFGPTALVVDQ